MSSLRRLCALAALVVIAAGCGKTTTKVVLPSPTPTPSPTLAPVAAVASSSMSAVIGASVSLDGSGSSDPQGGTLAYGWEMITRPDGSDAVLAGADSATPTFTPDVVGDYVVRLVVTDTVGLDSAPAYVDVAAATCGSAAPTIGAINASATHAPPLAGDLVSLSATGVSDPNGACGTLTAPFHYAWTLMGAPGGSQAHLSATTAAAPTFVPDVVGSYRLSLIVTDAIGNQSAPAFLDLTTSACGTIAPALSSIVVTPSFPSVASGATLQTTLTPSNPGCPAQFQPQSYSYDWSITAVPLGGHASLANGASAAFLTGDVPGVYGVTVSVTDSTGLKSAPVTTNVPMNSCGTNPPIPVGFSLGQGVPASGGGTAAIGDSPAISGGAAASTSDFYVGVPLAVAAVGISDADTSPSCGSLPPQPVSFSWTLVSAPAGSHASLSQSSGPSVGLTPDQSGPYVLSVTTRDDTGAASTNTVALNVGCGFSPPFVSAFVQQSAGGFILSPPNPLAVGYPVGVLANAGDVDSSANGACVVAEAQPLTYQWSITSAPAGSRAALLGPGTSSPSFVPDVTGAYELEAAVTDPQGHTTTTTTSVDVACNAVAPSLLVGPDNVPDWRVFQAVTVNGGANLFQVKASNPSLDSTSLGPPVRLYAGALVQLMANASTVQNVPGCPAFPMNLSYDWRVTSQPPGSTATLNNPSASSPSFTPDVAGPYTFQLKLTDANTGRSSTLPLDYDVNGMVVSDVGLCGTSVPTAALRVAGPTPSSGGGAVVEAKGSTVLLDGSGSSSPDATTYPVGCGLTRDLAYSWSLTRVAPGSTAQIQPANAVNPSFVADQVGTYDVKLTVSDGTHQASTTQSIRVVDLHTTTPGAATDPVFTSTAVDLNGRPVTAWWDPATAAIHVARCMADCNGASPAWSPLPDVDSGLGTLTFAAADEPRPLAVAVGPLGAGGGNVYVAYYTGGGVGSTTTGAQYCSVAIALWSGSGWATNRIFGAPAGSCDPGLISGSAYGRYVSLAIDPLSGGPIVGYSYEDADDSLAVPGLVWCNSSSCTSAGTFPGAFFSGSFLQPPTTGQKSGRWISVAAYGPDVHAAYYVEQGAGGAQGLGYTQCRNCFSGFNDPSTVVDSFPGVDLGRFSDLAVVPPTSANALSSAMLVVAYRDSLNQRARIATCPNGFACVFGNSWSTAPVPDPGGSASYGRDTRVAVGSDGLPLLAWYDDAGAQARVLVSSPGAPTTFVGLPAQPASATPAGLSLAGGPTANDDFLSCSTATGPEVVSGF